MKKLVLSTLLSTSLSLSMSALADAPKPINFTTINSVLQSVATQVLEAEQVKDAQGRDAVKKLDLHFDPELTNLEKRRVAFEARVGLSTSAWKPGEESELALRLDASAYDSDRFGHGSTDSVIALGLKTDVSALIYYAYQQLTKTDDPCTEKSIQHASNPQEVDFNRAACVELEQLKQPVTVGKFVQLAQSVLAKRLVYVNARLGVVAGAADKSEGDSLRNEIQYDLLAQDQIARGLKKDANGTVVGLQFDLQKTMTITGDTTLKSLYVTILPTEVSLDVAIDSPEAAAIYDENWKSFADQLRILERPDGDQQKEEMKQNIRQTFSLGVEFAKEWIVQGQK